MVSRALRGAPEWRRAPGRAAVAKATTQPAVPAHERARKLLVRLVLVVYLLAIFEGSIRKWLLPQFSQYVFFIRDPFLLCAYWVATQNALWPRNSGFMYLSVFMCGFGVVLMVLQAVTGGSSDLRLLLGVYGWRSYFLYIPLAFLIGAQFKREDLAFFTRLTLWLTVPIAALVAVQFFSPINSPINVGIAAEEELQFKGLNVSNDHVRPMGPFSSGQGQQQFAATACALLLAVVLMHAKLRPVGRIGILAAIGGVLTCAALSGSRATVLQCGMAGLFAMFLGIVGRGAALKSKALTIPLSLAVAAVTLYPIVFPEGFAAFTERWTVAAQVEGRSGGLTGRALLGFVDFTNLIEVVPALGYGLGFGGNASITLGATVDGIKPGSLAETDFARHMVDLGPALGMAFILFRVALAIWLLRQVLQATRLVSDPLPMMLFGYAFYSILAGQITGQGAVNVYTWLFTGLCIAATRQAFLSLPRRSPSAMPLRRPVSAPRIGIV